MIVLGLPLQCSATCGGGEQARHVMCVNQTSYERSVGCSEADRPADERICNSQPCAARNAGESSPNCAFLKILHYSSFSQVQTYNIPHDRK